MPITTVLSDLGNVVVLFENALTVDALLKRLVLPFECDRERIETVLFDERAGLWNLFDRGLIPWNAIVSTVLVALGAHTRPYGEAKTKAWTEEAWKKVFRPNAPVLGLWRRLKDAGIAFTITSNADPLRYEEARGHWPEDLFDHAVLSFEEGMIKQDGPEFFVRALDRSGCKAEEALCVDDRQDCLDVAAGLGIRTFRYDHRDHKALERELMLLGLPVLAP